jgi:hypothetical protein
MATREGGAVFFGYTAEDCIVLCEGRVCSILYLYKPHHINTDRPASLVSFLWQGKLADSVGNLVLSGTKSLMVQMHSGNGTVIWSLTKWNWNVHTYGDISLSTQQVLFTAVNISYFYRADKVVWTYALYIKWVFRDF